jgi:hypothetical protein
MKNWINWTIVLIIFYIIVKSNYKQLNLENYENWTDCVNQGYPKDWCLFTPDPLNPSPGYCNCGGNRYSGYRVNGNCNCYLHNPQLSTIYVDKLFHDYLN